MPAAAECIQTLAVPLAKQPLAAVPQVRFIAFHDAGYLPDPERTIAGTRLEPAMLDADRPRLGFQR